MAKDDLDVALEEHFGPEYEASHNTRSGIMGASNGEKRGVLAQLAQPVKDVDLEYRRALMLGAFETREEAMRMSAAIDERVRFGVDITPLVDLMHALMAVKGARGGRENGLIEGVTHHTMNWGDNFKDQGKKFLGKAKDSLS